MTVNLVRDWNQPTSLSPEKERLLKRKEREKETERESEKAEVDEILRAEGGGGRVEDGHPTTAPSPGRSGV